MPASRSDPEVAFVTGAGSGIGAATALVLAARGIAVALFDRSHEGVERTARELRGAGGEALALVGDVTDDAALRDAFEQTERRLGAPASVVAAAGIEMPGTVLEVDLDGWRRVLDVNLTGVFLTARHGVPRMLARGGGSFVAVSSDVGFRGSVGEIAYSAAKHGVVGLVRCLAVDHGRAGLRANAVCPGFVTTPLADRVLGDSDRSRHESAIPLGRFARPQEVARAISHLCSADAAYTTGTLYVIDGGAAAGQFSDGGAAPTP